MWQRTSTQNSAMRPLAASAPKAGGAGSSRRHRAAACLRSYAADDRGAITIEFLSWIPAFVMMLSLIADLSFVFLTNSSMWDVARDAARRVALHKMTTADVEEFVRERIVTTSRNFRVNAVADDEAVTITIATPINDATALRVYANLLPGDLVARVIMLREPE